MGKRQNLLKLFSQDETYNYHLVRTIDPNGHLLYLMKNGESLDQETLEFSPTAIVQELIKECSVEIEKFAPAIFWTKEFDTAELKRKLNNKISEDQDFSNFIETVKGEYRILEVQDSLLYNKDPEAYAEAKKAEYDLHQKELMEDFIKQHQESKNKREEMLLAYNNNLVKLLQEYFEGVIEFEKRDFDFTSELEKIVGSLINEESWIKINDKPFICKIELCSLLEDRMNVYLTDNERSYTATLRFEKTELITEDAVEIDDSITCPRILSDYDVLAQLYDIDTKSIPEWIYKNETDRFEYVIDYLVPIFKENKKKREKEYLDKINKEKSNDKEEKLEFGQILSDGEYDFNINNNNDEEMKKKQTNPSDWCFDVMVSPEEEIPSIIALFEDGATYLDDQLGSHSLSQNVIDALNRAGIFGDSEMMEAMWEVNDSESKTKEDIIKSMEQEGFVYVPNMLDNFN